MREKDASESEKETINGLQNVREVHQMLERLKLLQGGGSERLDVSFASTSSGGGCRSDLILSGNRGTTDDMEPEPGTCAQILQAFHSGAGFQDCERPKKAG